MPNINDWSAAALLECLADDVEALTGAGLDVVDISPAARAVLLASTRSETVDAVELTKAREAAERALSANGWSHMERLRRMC